VLLEGSQHGGLQCSQIPHAIEVPLSRTDVTGRVRT
jgi:hypothetical protein